MEDLTDKQKEIIRLARECIGTPFKHQGRQKGVGMDCIGLVRYPGVVLGLITGDYRNYSMNPNPSLMYKLLRQHLDEIPIHDLQPGDILWLRTDVDPQHLAILTERNTIIHAVNDRAGKNRHSKVVEHGYRHPWTKRLYRAFRYKEEK